MSLLVLTSSKSQNHHKHATLASQGLHLTATEVLHILKEAIRLGLGDANVTKRSSKERAPTASYRTQK